ncbi:PEP-CTERM sorting domain-containing protein [Massilia sp. HP4]|uniref:PEP-CTERM sorting domain-containing protein n=1 Tax=Massilia sp. HP4 TaxID=2562316 RepID=UPI0010C02477|nr:PEP-CTERM sorting domain-containing protein [Massilia sp. HP4]
MNRKTRLLAMASVILLGSISSAHAGFIGRQLSVDYFYPNPSTPYGQSVETPPVFIVGDGIETVVNVENVTSITVDVTDTSMQFDFSTSHPGPTWLSNTFNGLIFNLISGNSFDFSTASIDSSSTFAGFDISRVDFNDSRVAINWQGLSYNSDTILRINFEPNATEVPEPATLSLLGLGFMSAVAVRRRRGPGEFPAQHRQQ